MVSSSPPQNAFPVDSVFGDRIPEPASTIEVAPGVHWLRMPLPFAMGECIAHLNCLMHAGKINRQSDADGVLRFVAA